MKTVRLAYQTNDIRSHTLLFCQIMCDAGIKITIYGSNNNTEIL